MRYNRKFIAATAAIVSVSAAVSCGKKKKSSAAAAPAGSALTLSGTIVLTEETSASLTGDTGLALTDNSSDMLATNTLNCTVFSEPPVYKTGTFADDGKFSVDLDGTGYPMGCSVADASGAQVSSFVFKNDSKKDLAGAASNDVRISLNGSADLGTVTSSADNGTAEIDVSKIANVSSAVVSNGFDFTGKWLFAKATVLPTGYTAPCTEAEAKAARDSNDNKSCNGPKVGEPIWIKTLKGTSTTSGAAAYAVQVWKSEDDFKACGSKLGFTYADAKTKAGIDLSAAGVAEGGFTYTAGWEDGWKSSTARNGSWAMQDCASTTYKGKEAYKCTADNGDYRIQLPGGCFADATGKPVKIQDWSSMTGSAATTDSVTGLLKFVSKGTPSGGVASTCTNISGSFDSAGTAIAGNTQITPKTLVAASALCSSIGETTEALKLAKLRCYANGYWQESSSAGSSTCIRRVEMDWTATEASKFIMGSDGPAKAEAEHVIALLNYTDANTASLHDEHLGYRSVNVNGQMVNCKIREAFTMTLHRISDTSVGAEFISEEQTVDKGKAACVSEFSTKVMKNFMLLNKE